MRVAIIFICVAFYACSYRLVTPEQAGPVSVLKLGDFTDQTNHGGLGVWVRGFVGETLHARIQPRIQPSAAYELTGVVRASASSTLAYDAHTESALSRVDVTCTLKLTHPEQGLVWQGMPQRGYRMYARGVTPLDTRMAQRQATASAAEDAVRMALNEFLSQPRLIEVTPS